MSDYEKEFIKRARREIATRELTLTSVAEMIGSSRQVLSQILNGKFNSIRADTMLKLAMVLEISLDEIIFPETDLVVNSMTMAQALARYGVPEEEILQGIRNAARLDAMDPDKARAFREARQRLLAIEEGRR